MEPAAYEGQFTPLDLLDELMVREIDHTENVGSSFVNSVHSINNETVGSLRQRVFRKLEEFLASDNVRVAFSAAKSLGKIVSVFIPMRRDQPSEEEKTWHDAERNQALDIIQQRINCGALAVPTVWRIRKSLQTTADDERPSAAIRARAQAMLGSLSLPEMFCVFHVLCTDEWGYNTQEDGFYTVSDRRRAEESSAIAELTRKYPAPADQVRTIESLIRSGGDRRERPRVGRFVYFSSLRRSRVPFGVLRTSVAEDNSKLRHVAGLAIRAWRSTDQQSTSACARAFIGVPNDYHGSVGGAGGQLRSRPAERKC